MKNIYKLLKMVIVMLIAVTGLMAYAGTPLPSSAPSPMYVLYPPTNLTAIPMELWAFLNWDKPQDPGGTTPDGLLGYRIYRDGAFIHYNANPDSLSYWDYIDDVGNFTDSVTAYYDLTAYGYPGEFGESSAVSVTFIINMDLPFPFSEPWDMGMFSFQEWSFIPSQGNWIINTSQGNPSPTASFTGTPALTNYDNTLRSFVIVCIPWTCANVYFEFDSRLILTNPTSQEKMIIEIYYDNNWHPKDTLVNDISTGWVHHKIDITEVAGTIVRVGFRATGINSADIGEWDIDNIYVYVVCYKPPGFNLNRTGNIVHLSWGTPCTGKNLKPDKIDSSVLLGYDVYRTNADGLPPYVKLNQSLLTVNGYNDTIPLAEELYCYFVTAAYQDSWSGTFLCESPSDTLCVHYTSGIPEQKETQMRIYPNPVSDVLNIETDMAFTGIEILNFLGESIYSESFPKTFNITIPMKDNPSGIYLLKIKSVKGIIVRKAIKK